MGKSRRGNLKGPWLITCAKATAGLAALAGFVKGAEKLLDRFKGIVKTVNAIPGLEKISSLDVAAAVAACLVVVWLSWWLPRWRAEQRERRLARGTEAARVLLDEAKRKRRFQLEPIEPPENDESPIVFERADGRHEEILEWISKSRLPLLYVTGHSGSGKSSLMGAYVLPMLRRSKKGAAAIMLRAIGDFEASMRKALAVSGAVWDKPPDLDNLPARQCLEKAAAHARMSDRRVVLIFDQFEEITVGVLEEDWASLAAVVFIRELVKMPIKGVCVILAIRAEYADLIRKLSFPDRVFHETLEDVFGFTLPHATDFLRNRLWPDGSGPVDANTKAAALAMEADALCELPGRVVPIALNMIGVMYTENPVIGAQLARPETRAGEGLLAHYVRSRIESGELREAGPGLLNNMVTREGRRERPKELSTLAAAVKLEEGATETALLTLARHGLVRKAKEMWEISHDFLAPLIRRALNRVEISWARRLRPFLPVAAAALMGALVFGTWGFAEYRINRDAEEFSNCVNVNSIFHTLEFRAVPTRGAARHIARLGENWTIELKSASVSNPKCLEPFRNLNCRNVTKIVLSELDNADAWVNELARADSGLKNLTTLRLYKTKGTDAALKELGRPDSGFKALTTLEVEFTRVTDAGAKELANPDSGLKALRTLRLGGMDVSDAGLTELVKPTSGLKALTTLVVENKELTDAVMGELARSDSGLKALTTLELLYPRVTDEGLKLLARPESGLKTLTTLTIKYDHLSDTGMKELAAPHSGLKALTTLNLYHSDVTDEGLKALASPQSGLSVLTTLNLEYTGVTDAGVKELARPDSNLKTLKSLDVTGTRVTSAGMAELKRARPDLDVEKR